MNCSEEYHDLSCDPCSDKGTSLAASKYCPVCDELLCQGCVAGHLRNIVLKDHPLNDDLSASFKRKRIHPLALCDKHKTEKVEQYCETHNVLCCDNCRIVTHASCKITGIKRKSQSDNQSKLMQDSLQLIQTLQQNVKRIKATKENDIKSLKISKDQCFTEVRALKVEVDDLFVTLEKEVLDEVVKTEANIKSKIDEQIAEGENLLQQLHECKCMLEDCHSTRDNELMFIGLEKYRGDIEKMAKLVAKLQDITIPPDMQFEAFQDVTNMTKTLKRLGKVISGRYIANVMGVTVTPQKALDIDSVWISGSTFLESGELVLSDRTNSKLLLFSQGLTLKSDIQLSGQPWDVASITEHRVVATMTSDKRLQFVDISPTMKKSNKVKCKSRCYGISSTQSHLYVLLNDDAGNYPPEISVLEHDGRHVRTIKLSALGINRPQYIAVSRKGDRLYVTDAHRKFGGTNAILCLESQSSMQLFYFSSDTLQSPQGLFVDDNNHMLVCWGGSGNITVVTANGRHEGILLPRTDGMNRPCTLAYRPRDGILVVGMYNTSPVCRAFLLKSK